MPGNSNNHNLLSSWKEIASYLGCDERTCRRWELEYGLPAHRMEGVAKSRVYAYKNEIDSWQKSRLNGNKTTIRTAATVGATASEPPGIKTEGAGGITGYTLRSKLKSKLILWSIPLAAVVVAGAIFLIHLSPGQPADFKISGSRLIIQDEQGKKLWEFDTGLRNLVQEKKYRDHFNARRVAESGPVLLPYLMMRDMDGDGNVEVLFVPKTDDEHNETGIFCFNWKGKELWHYRPGMERLFGGHLFSSEYPIHGFELFDKDDNGSFEVVLLTGHQPHSPSELIVIDHQGKVGGEFVNWGRFMDIAFSDLDADGDSEVLVVGHNDEYRTGFLAVFDPSRISGSSPQSADYACQACGAGSAIFYLLFPRTDVDKILAPLKEAACRIDITPEGRFQVTTLISHIFFILDPQLRLLDVQGSDSFWLRHREFKAAGKISSELNDAYYENLKKGVLYWDGTQWTSTPTMNRNGVE